MTRSLPFAELEQVYDLLAEAVDTVGEEGEALLLAELCLILAHRLGDLEAVRDAIVICLSRGAAAVGPPSV